MEKSKGNELPLATSPLTAHRSATHPSPTHHLPATDPLARRPVLRFLRRIIRNWRLRHQHPFNFAIHLIGIPAVVTGVVLLFFLPWYWGVGLFVLGYLLQFIGHQVEGNDVGEWAGVKRLLGLPYVSIAPPQD
jgi:Protein of unknown function (DUF962)